MIGFGVIYSTWTTNYTNLLCTGNALTETSLIHCSSSIILTPRPQVLQQKASEEATGTDEPAEEAVAESQTEVESEDVEPSNPPEDEGDKFETNSSPSKAQDNSEKEREEPTIPTQPKTRKKYIIQEEEEEDLEEEPSIPVLASKGKDKGKVKMATSPASEDEMEQVDAELAAVVARVTPTPEQAKQLLAIIAAVECQKMYIYKGEKRHFIFQVLLTMLTFMYLSFL